MNSVLLTCLTIIAVIVVAYLIYMAIGMFLFKRAAKQHGSERTIVVIRPTKKKRYVSLKRQGREVTIISSHHAPPPSWPEDKPR